MSDLAPLNSDVVEEEDQGAPGASISVDSLKAKAEVTPDLLKQKARPSVVNQTIDFFSGIKEMGEQGFTLSLKDEVQALGGAVGTFIGRSIQDQDVDFGEEYDKELAKARLPVQQFREEFPVSATVAEIGGGIVTGAPVRQAATAGFTGLRNILTGAGFGGVTGAASSEGDLVDRAVAGGFGTFGGGALTAVMQPIVRGLGALGSRTLTKTERVALNDVVRAFERDGVPLDEAMSRLKLWREQGAKPEILADLGGDNVRGLLRAAISVPGPARARGDAILRPRQLGQGERVFQDALEALAPGTTPRTVAQTLAKARSAEANPLYEAARAQPLRLRGEIHSVNDLLDILNRPTMKRAVKIAMRQADDLGKSVPKVIDGKGNVSDVPDVEMLDWIKRQGLDSIIERFRDKTTGRLNASDPQVRTLLSLKDEFLGVVDDLSPSYRAAREAFAGQSELLSALDQGKRFIGNFRRDPQISEDILKRMTKSEREFFRVGLAQNIQDILEVAPDGADGVKRIFGTQRLREALEIAMPDEASFARFESAVTREANMVRTNRIAGLQSGSPTARIAEEVLDLTADIGITPGSVLAAAAGEPTPLAGQVIARLARQSGQGLKADVADAVGQILMAGEPEEVARLLVRLDSIANAGFVSRMLESAGARGAGTLTGELSASGSQVPGPVVP